MEIVTHHDHTGLGSGLTGDLISASSANRKCLEENYGHTRENGS